MCFIADDGPAEVYNEHFIKKSRKAHKCSDCFKIIPAGSSYRRVDMVFMGDFSTFPICNKCEQLRKGIVQVEMKEGCARHESEPLMGCMFEQIYGGADHYYKELKSLGLFKEAEWLLEQSPYLEKEDAEETGLIGEGKA